MRIDAQVGLVDRSRFEYPWMTSAPSQMQRDFAPDALWRILSRNKYDGAVVLATGPSLDWVLSLTGEHSWIAAVIGDRLDIRHPRYKAIRHVHGADTAGTLEDAATAGLAVDFAVTPDQAESAIEVLSHHPRTRVALVPAAGPGFDPAPWQAFARLDHVMVKVCGLINEAGAEGWRAETYRPLVQALLTWFGPERVMYGSDWPYCMYSGTWKESLAAFTQALGAQTMEVRSKILGENAARHYGIG